MPHAPIGRREEVDSRLLVVGSQTASLTPGLSFAHNLGCRCPNRQCEGIFDIYVSRPFQWHQEHPNARCFCPFCWALNIRESRKTPNLQLFQVLGFTPTLGQSGVATQPWDTALPFCKFRSDPTQGRRWSRSYPEVLRCMPTPLRHLSLSPRPVHWCRIHRGTLPQRCPLPELGQGLNPQS